MRTLALAVMVCLAGCAATVPMASPGMDATAKRFTAPSDRAAVYVVRTDFRGMNELSNVGVDGQIVGSLTKDSYLIIDLSPGSHQLYTLGPENSDRIALNVSAGRCYFVRVSFGYGSMSHRWYLQQIPDDEGRKAVLGSSLVQALR